VTCKSRTLNLDLNLDIHITFSSSPNGNLEHKFFYVSKHGRFRLQLNAFRSMRTWTPEECCSEAHGGPQLVNNYRPPLPLGNRVLRECGAMWDEHVEQAYYNILYLFYDYINGRHQKTHPIDDLSKKPPPSPVSQEANVYGLIYLNYFILYFLRVSKYNIII